MNPSSRVASLRRTISLAAAALLAAGVLLAAPAAAAPFDGTISPVQGPTAGGTAVRLGVGLPTFATVSGGNGFALGLTTDGQVYGWGAGGQGRLGTGSMAAQAQPMALDTTGVLAGKEIVQVEAGEAFGLALDADGQVYAWGAGSEGQLGNGSNANSTVPVAVDTSGVLAGKRIVRVAAGQDFALALDADGLVYAWGNGANGRLGTGSSASSAVPVAVRTIGVLAGRQIAQVSAGEGYALAVDTEGVGYAWGTGANGRLGTGSSLNQTAPAKVVASGVLAGKQLTQVSAGGTHSLALDADGAVYAWGNGANGRLGIGPTTTNYLTATPVAVDPAAFGGVAVAGVVASASHSVAITEDGGMFTWGNNSNVNLGNGTSANVPQLTPAPVDPSAAQAGTVFVQAASRSASSYALDATGTVYAWGFASGGQLGTGPATNVVRPTPVLDPELRVLFGGVEAASVARVDPGTVEAITPPHPAAVVAVDILVGGVPTTLPAAYTYGTAPALVHGPESGQAVPGEQLTLRAAATGDETPVADWQTLDPGTGEWATVADGVGPQTDQATTALTLTVPATTSWYRVTFTNALGSVTTEPARIAPLDLDASTIAVDADRLTADGRDSTTARVYLVDTTGAAFLPEVEVRMTTTADCTLGEVGPDGEARYAAALTAGTSPGVATQSFTVNGLPATATADVLLVEPPTVVVDEPETAGEPPRAEAPATPDGDLALTGAAAAGVLLLAGVLIALGTIAARVVRRSH